MKASRGISTDNVVVRIPKDVKKLAELVAHSKGMTLSDYFREQLYEAIEDEYDLKAAQEAYEEYLKNPVTIPWEDLKKEIEDEKVQS